MPAKSKDQAVAARLALQAKKGKISVYELGDVAKKMFKSMTTRQLEEFTKR